MRPHPPAPDRRGPAREPVPENVSGLVERVTFFNEESGFAVLKVKVRGHREPVTVVGSLPSVTPGEWLTAEGQWRQDREFGMQFSATLLKTSAPTTLEGIEKYLGSGMVRGIGPVYAQKLVARFGDKIFEIIESESGRLEDVEGIGPKRRKQIKEAWAEQKAVREIMLFLHSQGVSTSRAVRIYKIYGANAIEEVRANPYALARDIPGVGFKTADQIAQNIGIPHDSILRACAGVRQVLMDATSEGHCALPVRLLKEAAGKLLLVDDAILETALRKTVEQQEILYDTIDGEELVFLPHLQRAEQTVAVRLRKLAQGAPGYPPIQFEKALAWCQDKTGKALAPTQVEALRMALTRRVLVITGGPGVGKTTLVNSILLILRAKKVRCQLCAPTGRAARRLSETTGLEAKTIHRLLEAQGAGGKFNRNPENPLECDLLVVDECSMVDTPLMSSVLKALPPGASLLLVGDVDQLPSVGPGMVLRHIIESGMVPVARLHEVFRQAAHSRIIVNAHRINQGLDIEMNEATPDSDFFFVDRETPERILEMTLEMVTERIPSRFGLDPIRDVQVLSPMNRGLLGVRELNQRLQAALNPPRPDSPAVEKFGWTYRVGDKVIQTQNNYDKEVFNGDIGQVTEIDVMDRVIQVRYEGREVRYDFGELDEIALAYAITIHKSQGSEFPAVVIPLSTQHYMMLQRNLVYTGITRGRKLVVMTGQRKALGLAIRNAQMQHRFSGLLARLQADPG